MSYVFLHFLFGTHKSSKLFKGVKMCFFKGKRGVEIFNGSYLSKDCLVLHNIIINLLKDLLMKERRKDFDALLLLYHKCSFNEETQKDL